jgi:hypothetical protein
LIEGSNQMDYIPVLLDFHYCFPSLFRRILGVSTFIEI